MSPRAPHRCPGQRGKCSNKIPAGTRHCPDCQQDTAWLKTTGDERPDTGRAEHRHIRDEVLERDAHRCTLQYDGCTREATEMDHVIPVVEGGQTTAANGRAACRSCHAKRSARQGAAASAAARRGGYTTDPAVREALIAKRRRGRENPPPDTSWEPMAPIRTGPRR